MPIANPNFASYTAPFIHDYLNRCRVNSIPSFRLIDVGSRGGIRHEWHPIQPYSQFVGFDADAAECERLNTLHPNIETHPVALAGKSGKFPFYITKSDHCYGFRQGNDDFWSRFPNSINNQLKEVWELEATSFDEWVSQTQYQHIDFVKLDTEGTEADILSGMSNSLSSKKILGVLTELWFEGVTKLGQGYGFTAQNDLLQSFGFQLFDIEVSRYPRTSMPVGKLSLQKNTNGSNDISVTAPTLRKHYGQVLTGDILYFRDPILDFKNDPKNAEKFWDDESILRLIVLLELYNYHDVALEILSFFKDKFPRILKECLVSALLKQSTEQGDINILYSDYWRVSKDLFVATGGCNSPDIVADLNIEPAKFY